MPDPTDEIKSILASCSPEAQRDVLAWLRARHPIHPLEVEFGASAEVILGAIARAADLSRRGMLGLIAEASFKVNVVDQLEGWHDDVVVGNVPFDFQLSQGDRQIRIQVKRQRIVRGEPMRFRAGSDLYVAETQRSRRGIDPRTGEDTRPYRFGEFDILAVCMQPATGDWTSFRFTLQRWLVPRVGHLEWLRVLQPISVTPNDDWSENLDTCLAWLASDIRKTVRQG